MNKLFASLVITSLALSGCKKIADNEIVPSDLAKAPASLYAVQSVQVTYSYQGNTFNLFSGGGSVLSPDPDPLFTSYTKSDRVTAVLTLSEPLSGGLNLQDVRNFPGFSLTMMDGHQIMTMDPFAPGEVFVSTDANGNIVAPWSVFINCCLFPNNNIYTLNWAGNRGIGDGGGLTVPNGSFPDTPRDQGMIFDSPGTWTTDIRTPEELIVDLRSSVQSLINEELNYGQAHGLIKPLENALRSINKGKIRAACSQLADFIAKVNAMTPPLSASSATSLIAEARAIQAAIGC